MIAGAAALLGSPHLPRAFAAPPTHLAGNSVGLKIPQKPKNHFTSTFTPQLLPRSLISASGWHPYPKAGERQQWRQVPKQIADITIARAEKAKGTAWEAFPATVFLEYKRNGNRSHFERYIADVHINGPWFVDYGDAPPKMDENGEFIYRIGTAIGDETLEKYGALNASADAARGEEIDDDQGRLARALPNILASAEAIAAEKQDALVRDAWYPDLCLMTARVKEGSSDGFYLAMQAAPNQRAHGHNDSGSFIVFHDGNPVIVDIGPEAYTAPRYKFSVQSAYHNLPTVGGVMQSNKSPDYRATEVRYSSDDSRATVSMNLAIAYPAEAGITRSTRALVLDRAANRIQLQEDFQLQKKVPVQLSFMTPCVPTLDSKGNVVLAPPGTSARSIRLSRDASLITPPIETIDLTDDWLVSRWGKIIYRVLLSSAAPTDSGKWNIELS